MHWYQLGTQCPRCDARTTITDTRNQCTGGGCCQSARALFFERNSLGRFGHCICWDDSAGSGGLLSVSSYVVTRSGACLATRVPSTHCYICMMHFHRSRVSRINDCHSRLRDPNFRTATATIRPWPSPTAAAFPHLHHTAPPLQRSLLNTRLTAHSTHSTTQLVLMHHLSHNLNAATTSRRPHAAGPHVSRS